MEQADWVIRGATLVDGTGGAPYEGDVAVSAGRIQAVGKVAHRGREEIDAKGLIVTPGFTDIHTHYDGQATWTGALSPSSLHGVTSVIMGNCGVGFAPCKPSDHDRLIRLMEGVEDIPFPVLAEGLPWAWESFPNYLDFLSTQRFDADLGAQLPHAALRVYVMGERGVAREPATPDDIAEMRRICAHAMQAGAIGFSTSRSLNHRDSDGNPTPSLTAGEDELLGIALGMKDAGQGVFQIASDFREPENEIAMLRRIAESSGRPLSLSLAQSDLAPEHWRILLGAVEKAHTEGIEMRAQVAPRPVGVLLGLELTLNPFSAHPSYMEIATRPLQERVAALRDPNFRARLLAEEPHADNVFVRTMLRRFGKMFRMGETFDYEPPPSETLEAIAARAHKSPEEIALDLMLERDGRGMVYLPFLNYAEGSLDAVSRMMTSPSSLPGLSDGGAHVGMICDGSFTTTLLTHWTRDRTRGPRQTLQSVVRRQSRLTAEWAGLYDRGLLQPGQRADLNVIDLAKLKLHLPEIVRDLPANGRRLMQRAEGYKLTLVNGVATLREDQPTGARPGRLVRGGHEARVAAE